MKHLILILILLPSLSFSQKEIARYGSYGFKGWNEFIFYEGGIYMNIKDYKSDTLKGYYKNYYDTIEIVSGVERTLMHGNISKYFLKTDTNEIVDLNLMFVYKKYYSENEKEKIKLYGDLLNIDYLNLIKEIKYPYCKTAEKSKIQDVTKIIEAIILSKPISIFFNNLTTINLVRFYELNEKNIQLNLSNIETKFTKLRETFYGNSIRFEGFYFMQGEDSFVVDFILNKCTKNPEEILNFKSSRFVFEFKKNKDEMILIDIKEIDILD